MNNYILYFIIAVLIISTSCKKEKKPEPVYEHEIISLVFNLGAISTYDRDSRIVTVKIADYINRARLAAVFQLSQGAKAMVNGIEQLSSTTTNDFTQPVKYTIIGKDNKNSEWTIKMESNNVEIGLGKVVQAEKRLERSYEWYQTQDTSGRFSNLNGGPACIAMALNYVSRSAFAGLSAATVREEADALAATTIYKVLHGQTVAGTGVFTTVDISNYLNFKTGQGVVWKHIYLSPQPDYSEITDCIDKGYPVILLADMSKIGYNVGFPNQHTDRYYDKYPTTAAGHYIVIKGYKKVDGMLWYEVYDPYTLGQRYTLGNEIKGWNRYYSAESVRRGCVSGQDGWGYAFVLNNRLFTAFAAPLKNETSLNESARLMNRDVPMWKYGF